MSRNKHTQRNSLHARLMQCRAWDQNIFCETEKRLIANTPPPGPPGPNIVPPTSNVPPSNADLATLIGQANAASMQQLLATGGLQSAPAQQAVQPAAAPATAAAVPATAAAPVAAAAAPTHAVTAPSAAPPAAPNVPPGVNAPQGPGTPPPPSNQPPAPGTPPGQPHGPQQPTPAQQIAWWKRVRSTLDKPGLSEATVIGAGVGSAAAADAILFQAVPEAVKAIGAIPAAGVAPAIGSVANVLLPAVPAYAGYRIGHEWGSDPEVNHPYAYGAAGAALGATGGYLALDLAKYPTMAFRWLSENIKRVDNLQVPIGPAGAPIEIGKIGQELAKGKPMGDALREELIDLPNVITGNNLWWVAPGALGALVGARYGGLKGAVVGGATLGGLGYGVKKLLLNPVTIDGWLQKPIDLPFLDPLTSTYYDAAGVAGLLFGGALGGAIGYTGARYLTNNSGIRTASTLVGSAAGAIGGNYLATEGIKALAANPAIKANIADFNAKTILGGALTGEHFLIAAPAAFGAALALGVSDHFDIRRKKTMAVGGAIAGGAAGYGLLKAGLLGSNFVNVASSGFLGLAGASLGSKIFGSLFRSNGSDEEIRERYLALRQNPLYVLYADADLQEIAHDYRNAEAVMAQVHARYQVLRAGFPPQHPGTPQAEDELRHDLCASVNIRTREEKAQTVGYVAGGLTGGGLGAYVSTVGNLSSLLTDLFIVSGSMSIGRWIGNMLGNSMGSRMEAREAEYAQRVAAAQAAHTKIPPVPAILHFSRMARKYLGTDMAGDMGSLTGLALSGTFLLPKWLGVAGFAAGATPWATILATSSAAAVGAGGLYLGGKLSRKLLEIPQNEGSTWKTLGLGFTLPLALGYKLHRLVWGGAASGESTPGHPEGHPTPPHDPAHPTGGAPATPPHDPAHPAPGQPAAPAAGARWGDIAKKLAIGAVSPITVTAGLVHHTIPQLGQWIFHKDRLGWPFNQIWDGVSRIPSLWREQPVKAEDDTITGKTISGIISIPRRFLKFWFEKPDSGPKH